MNIGNLNIEKTAALAPMAGVADRAFREICIEQGAAYVVGEMCSAKGVTYDSAKSKELLKTYPEEQPCSVQLFSDDPQVIYDGVKIALEYNPIIIDINMGCPAPKIVNGGAGSKLMKNLPLAGEILCAAVEASTVPVTVKFRKGWDSHTINAVELATIAQKAGVSALAVHGRTKEQMYRPPVDLDIIKAVKDAVDIPVIGNGGVTSIDELVHMYEYTGCDLVMVGQGALGRPWFFRQIKEYMLSGKLLPDPSLEEKMEIFRRHILKAVEYKGEGIALKEARTHAAWYMKGFEGAAALRRESSSLTTLEDLDKFIQLVLSTIK